MTGKRQRGGPAEWPFDIQRTKIIKDGRWCVAQIGNSTDRDFVTISGWTVRHTRSGCFCMMIWQYFLRVFSASVVDPPAQSSPYGRGRDQLIRECHF